MKTYLLITLSIITLYVFALMPEIFKSKSNIYHSKENRTDTIFPPLIFLNNHMVPDTVNLDSINANDIRSITILNKDSVIKLYGKRAANGAMKIILKSK